MSDTDAEKFLNSQAGDTVKTDEVMKFEPDILQNGEDKFYSAMLCAKNKESERIPN